MPKEERSEMPPEVGRLLSAMGGVLSVAMVFSVDHERTVPKLDAAFAALAPALAARPRLRLDIIEGRLHVGGQPLPPGDALVRSLAARLATLRISGFSMRRGMPRAEFTRLMRVLATSRPGGFEKALDAEKLQYVRAEKMELRPVDEDEKKEDPEAPAPPSEGVAGVLDLDGTPVADAAPESPPAASVGSIVAFLKGEPLGAGTAEDLARQLSDPERLAGLILEAAAIRQADPALAGGESLADLVLGCLRRTYEGLREATLPLDDELRMERRKSLFLLEKSILDRLRKAAGRADPAVDAVIREKMRELQEDFDIGEHVAQYARDHVALQQSERVILAHLQGRGPEAVAPWMARAGLPASDWQRLLVRGRREEDGAALPGGLEALAEILERFDEVMRAESRSPDAIAATAAQVDAHVEEAERRAETRLAEMEAEVQALRRLEAGRTDDRTALLRMLADLVEEFLQPLTVIHCAVEMLRDGCLGEVSPDQRRTLVLAAHSSERAKALLDRLLAVVGFPEPS